jgi:hypothetical protein
MIREKDKEKEEIDRHPRDQRQKKDQRREKRRAERKRE